MTTPPGLTDAEREALKIAEGVLHGQGLHSAAIGIANLRDRLTPPQPSPVHGDGFAAWWDGTRAHGSPFSDSCCRATASVAWSAALAAAQPVGGFVVVPVEPTTEMVSAALGHLYAHFAKDGARPFGQFVPGCTAEESECLSQQWYGPDRLRNAYAAMLAARPNGGQP